MISLKVTRERSTRKPLVVPTHHDWWDEHWKAWEAFFQAWDASTATGKDLDNLVELVGLVRSDVEDDHALRSRFTAALT